MFRPTKKPSITVSIILIGIVIVALITAGILYDSNSLFYEAAGISLMAICLILVHQTLCFRPSMVLLLSLCALTHASVRVFTLLELPVSASPSTSSLLTLPHLSAVLYGVSAAWLGWQSQLGLIHHRYQRRLNSSLGPVLISIFFALGLSQLSHIASILIAEVQLLEPFEKNMYQFAGILLGALLVRFHIFR